MLTAPTHNLINRQQLHEYALFCRHAIDKLVVSWTGGSYDQVDTDYHLNIGPKGQVYMTCQSLFEPKAHIRGSFDGTLGIALDCGKGATCSEALMDKGDFGTYPPTQEQLLSLGLVIAVLCQTLQLPVTCAHVCTQWEIACKNGYGPQSKDPHPRFDLIALPYYERFKDCYSMFGCCYLRKLAKQELSNLRLS